MKRSLLILPVTLLAVCPLAIAQDFSRYEVKSEQLAEHLFMMTGAGGNLAACIGNDGVLMVDADYAEMSDKVKAAVTALSDAPIRYVLNTHWHFDHVGGNESFAGWDATVVAHENVRKHMAVDQFITIIDAEVPASPAAALPMLTFTDAIDFHLNSEDIHIYHPPSAHTDGDAVVHFRKANVIHTGDLVFFCGYPFIDVSHGGTIDGMIAAVAEIVALCDDQTRIIPGHGPLTDRAGLETYLGMLRDFREVIAREKSAGKDLETILAEQPTSAVDAKWDNKMFPSAQFTRMVYLSLGDG